MVLRATVYTEHFHVLLEKDRKLPHILFRSSLIADECRQARGRCGNVASGHVAMFHAVLFFCPCKRVCGVTDRNPASFLSTLSTGTGCGIVIAARRLLPLPVHRCQPSFISEK
jgi:hypothetical protein